MEEKKTQTLVKEETCNCEAIKAELDQTKAELAKVNDLNKKYEEAYSELFVRYNKLRAMLDNTIEYSLGVK